MNSIHQYPSSPVNTEPIQVANDQFMTVKEAMKYLIFLLEVISLRL